MVFLAASFVLLIVPGVILGWMALASYVDGDSYNAPVREVQRFSELRDAARKEIWKPR